LQNIVSRLPKAIKLFLLHRKQNAQKHEGIALVAADHYCHQLFHYQFENSLDREPRHP